MLAAMSLASLSLVVTVALAAVDADAPPPDPIPEVKERVPPAPPRTWAMVRGGLSNDPTILQACGELIPIEGALTVRGQTWHTGLSVEGCGNGAGFLFQNPAPEIAHFRAKWKLWAFDSQWGWFEPIVSLGFAELQTGGDTPGFTFGGTGSGGNSTSGPEAGTSLRYKLPLGLGFELLGEAGISVAYFAYARELNTPADPYQTSLVLSAGLGW
jgi:hypothetical protein